MSGSLSKFFLLGFSALFGITIAITVSPKMSYAQGLVAPAPPPTTASSTAPVSSTLPSMLFNGGAFANDQRTATEAVAEPVVYGMGGSVETFRTTEPSSVGAFASSKQAGWLKVGLGILSASLCALGIGLGATTLGGKGAAAAAVAVSTNTPETIAAATGSAMANTALGAFYIVAGLSAPYLVLTLGTLGNLF
jgi:hypothetical protein